MGDVPEIWKNETRGKVGVRKYDPRTPGATRVELVAAGGQVLLSPEERRLTEEMVRKPVDNPFRNGRLVPIQIAEDAEDVQAIRTDPNTITRGEIDKLFEGSLRQLESRLAKIDSPAALQRILDVANDEGASTRRVQAIRDRLTAAGGTVTGDEPVTAGATPSGRDPWYPPQDGGLAPEGGAATKVG